MNSLTSFFETSKFTIQQLKLTFHIVKRAFHKVDEKNKKTSLTFVSEVVETVFFIQVLSYPDIGVS